MRSLLGLKGILEVDGDLYECRIIGVERKIDGNRIQLEVDCEAYSKLLLGWNPKRIIILIVELNLLPSRKEV